MAWHGLVGDQATAERFAQMAEAGFTHSLGWQRAEAVQQTADSARSAGVSLIVRVPVKRHDLAATEAALAPVVEAMKGHPAVAGYFIVDEPGAEAFDALAELVARLRRIDPDKLFYINLLPTYASPKHQLQAQTYEQYVRLFLQKVPVQVLSFDHYPVSTKGLSKDFYLNLEIISRLAVEHRLSFWAFALSTPHFSFPAPTLGHLRLQQYSNLAYGAQGLQYFTYTTPRGEDFRPGPLDRELNPTATYELVRQVNQELQARAWVFMGSQVLSVGHVGEPLPEGTRLYEPAEPVQSVRVEGKGAVVSLLANGDRRHLVIVNRDHESPARLKVAWASGTAMQEVGPQGKATPLAGDSLERPLEAGDACILVWGAGPSGRATGPDPARP